MTTTTTTTTAAAVAKKTRGAKKQCNDVAKKTRGAKKQCNDVAKKTRGAKKQCNDVANDVDLSDLLTAAAHDECQSRQARKDFKQTTAAAVAKKTRGAKEQCNDVANDVDLSDLLTAAAAAVEVKAMNVLKSTFSDISKIKRYAGVSLDSEKEKALAKQVKILSELTNNFSIIWQQLGNESIDKRAVTPNECVKVYGSTSFYFAVKNTAAAGEAPKYIKHTPSTLSEVLKSACSGILPAKKEQAARARALRETREQREEAHAMLALTFDEWKDAKTAKEPGLYAAVANMPGVLENVWRDERAAKQKIIDEAKSLEA